MHAIIAQHLQHSDVLGLRARLLQYRSRQIIHHDGISRQDQRRFALLLVVDFGGVHGLGFFGCRCEDVLEGFHCLWEVLDGIAWDDFEGEAQEGEDLATPG
ncbi:hypothetical protein CNMCM8812_000645 [Aspergillus fumigatus]|nr:hypothetical protein CNMCM8714_000545 [Aspergillus fumigatus]KAF4252503.1 hypothetical protein CNMCM8812_000645 [Aspergillus fumigatus]